MPGTLKTFILMAGLTAFFALCGALIAGVQGMVIAIAIAAAMNIFSYWNADKLVLRMYKAREVDALSSPNFHGIIATLAQRAGLPMPRVYIIDSDQPNAFATGRNPQHAAVAATTGLLNRLTTDEIMGVMAHELAHVKNRDTLTMTVTATIAGAISTLANMAWMFSYRHGNDGRRASNPLIIMLVSVLAPLAAMIIQMAISRTREFEADRVGAGISGKPEALASALNKIANNAAAIPNMTAEDHPATAHMFIINPLHMRAIDGLFSTHPRTEDRIERLMSMARTSPAQNDDKPNDPFVKWLDDDDHQNFGNTSTHPLPLNNPWDPK